MLAGVESCSAVAEDKALLGSNLSAVDGPGLVGVRKYPAASLRYSKTKEDDYGHDAGETRT